MLEATGWRPGERIEEAGFAEQDFGEWEGKTHDALAREGSADYAAFWDNPARNRPPGGESFADVTQRVAPVFQTLTETCLGRDIVLIGHGGSIRAIVAAMLGLTPENALALEISPLSLSLADHAGTPGDAGALSPWRVRCLNRRDDF